MNPNIMIDLLASLTVLTSPVSWFYALPQFLNAIQIKNQRKHNVKDINKQLIKADEFISIALCCESWMFYFIYIDSPKQVIMNLIPTLIFLAYSVWADIINDSKLVGFHFIGSVSIWGLISYFVLNQFMNGVTGTIFQVAAVIARLKETLGIIADGDGKLINIKSLLILSPNQLCWLCVGIQLMDPFMMISRGFDTIVSIIQFLVYLLIRPDQTKRHKLSSNDKKKQ